MHIVLGSCIGVQVNANDRRSERMNVGQCASM